MSQQSRQFDFWYAVHNTKIVRGPTRALETFGATCINYRHLAELPDDPRKIRIREGRLEAHRPLVITPTIPDIEMDGFGEAARAYFEFLRQNEKHLRILRYGYHLKSDNFSEQIVTDRLQAVAERVKSEVLAANDQFAAVIHGVDEPWDVALVELWLREIRRSAGENIRELDEKGLLYGTDD